MPYRKRYGGRTRGSYRKLGRRGAKLRKRVNNPRKRKQRIYKKRVARPKVRSSVGKQVVRMKKDITKLKQVVKGTTGTYIFRFRGATFAAAPIQKWGDVMVFGQDKDWYDGRLAEFKYYDEDTNNFGPMPDPSKDTDRDWFMNIFKSIQIKNNTAAPAVIQLRYCQCKSDTDYTPVHLYNLSISDLDIEVVGYDSSSMFFNPEESATLKQYFYVKKYRERTLMPGQSLNYFQKFTVRYNDGEYLSGARQYQRRYKSNCWWIRIRGILGHDKDNIDHPIQGQGRVDVQAYENVTCTYNAGAQIKYVICHDNRYEPTDPVNGRVSLRFLPSTTYAETHVV